MTTISHAPRIYVACLASYNAGQLHGAWIECHAKSADDIQEEIQEMLKASKVHSAEEWAIHDYEGFAGLTLSEWPDLEQVAGICEVLSGDNQDAARGLVWLVRDRGYSVTDAIARCDEVGTYTSDAHDLAADYAQEIASDVVEGFEEKSNQWPFSCIDWSAAGRELMIGGDIDIYETYINGDHERFVITNASEF